MAVGMHGDSADAQTGYDAPSGETDWPNAATNTDPRLMVWLR